MKNNNPFLVSSYVSPKYFCDRKNEAERVINAINNRKNIILSGRKGIGKTALIHHVLYSLNKEKETASYYLNIQNCTKIKDLLKLFLRKMSNDNNRGLANDLESKNDLISIVDRILNELETKKSEALIIIDEFQQINNFSQVEIDQLIPKLTERFENIRFIFLVDDKNKILSLFNNYDVLNVQNTDSFELDQIDQKKYKNFIKRKFSKIGVKIDKESIDLILYLTRGYTFYTQFTCNKLFFLNIKKLNTKIVKQTFDDIINENEHHFLAYKNLLSFYQWKLLSAIAREGEARQITSGEFIRKYSLNAPSSVKTAEKSLLEKKMIHKDFSGYTLNNVFLERWLAKV